MIESLKGDDPVEEKVEIFMSGQALPIADCYLVVSLQQLDNPKKEILKTKVYPELNPNFAESIVVRFTFDGHFYII